MFMPEVDPELPLLGESEGDANGAVGEPESEKPDAEPSDLSAIDEEPEDE